MVVQLLTEINEVVFDKTGTLTENKNGQLHFEEGNLSETEKNWISQLTAQSVHPLSKMIRQYLGAGNGNISYFNEIKGMGIEGVVEGNFIRLGNAEFIGLIAGNTLSSEVNVEINHEFRGYFTIKAAYRNNWKEVLRKLGANFRMALVSGDNAEERANLSPFFDANRLLFNQKPQDKLNFIKHEQDKGQHILMIGDGLNDAGALRQSNVGIALSEDVQAFSPACDAILDASKFDRLTDFLGFSKTALNIVKASFVLSLVYNFIGIGWAVSGQLSPVMAAIFMPLSSLSVVLFAVGMTYLFARIRKLI